MAVDGKHGVGRAAEVLGVYQEMDCDIVALQKTSNRRQAGDVVYCSGESGGDGGREKGQGGVGLVVHKIISRAEVRSPEFISDRLLKVTHEVCGRARAVAFFIGCALTDTQAVGESTLVGQPWRTGRRGGEKIESEECKVFDAYGRDTVNDDGDRLLSFSANHGLALYAGTFNMPTPYQ